MSISLVPESWLKKFQEKEITMIHQLLIREQRHAFFSKKTTRIMFLSHHLQVARGDVLYIVSQTSGCQSNFERNTVELTEDGTWRRGGRIWCGKQTITIGIGNSVPQIQ